MKRGKLGTADPRDILAEEHARLESGDITHVYGANKAQRSHLLDQEMSKWLSASLQEQQIVKASEGQSLSYTDPSLSSSIQLASALHPHGGASSSPGKANRPAVISYEVFEEMFEKYSKLAEEKKKKEHSSEMGSVDGTSPSKTVSVVEPYDSLGGDSSVSGGIYPHPHPHPQEHGLRTSHLPKAAEQLVEAVDIIQVMTETDPKFDAFMKLSLREKPAGRMLFRGGNLTKPRKLKTVAPLGRSAVVLTDSKGKVKLESRKGFLNHFREPPPVHDDGEDDLDEADAQANRPNDFIDGVVPPYSANTEFMRDRDQQLQTNVRAEGEGDGDDEAGGGLFGITTDASVTVTGLSDRQVLSPSSQERTKNRVKIRGKIRNPLGVIAENDPAGGGDGDESLQAKLMSVFDVLDVPVFGRLDFMRKYSAHAYATEMPKAIDLWAEVAIFVVIRLEFFKLYKKFSAGFCVFPMEATALLRPFKSQIPAILQSTALSLVPTTFHPDIGTDIGSVPASVTAIIKVEDTVNKVFGDMYPGGLVESQDGFLSLLESLSATLDDLLMASIRNAYDELDDVVTYGTHTCKEWVSKTKLKGKQSAPVALS